jgi:glycosyltransferase involved in cell wall biosynthesis
MEKNMNSKLTPEVSWFTPPGIGSSNGYGSAAVHTIKALQELGINVPFQSNNLQYNKNTNSYCHISFVQPEHYQGRPDQYKVGYTNWESSVIPEQWIKKMQAMNEIWAPSTYVVDVFKSYNVNDNIKLVPHGFDPEVWKITQRYKTDSFTFLHVGGPTERKGGQKVVDAFIELFDGQEEYKLVLKSSGPTETRLYIKNVFGRSQRHPQITVIDEILDPEGLAKLYASANCLVYPTNGEGFGLIPFQGVVTGLPTIVTNATACTDFASYAIPLNWTEIEGNGVHLGRWAEPDLNHLRELMIYVVANYDKEKERAIESARILQSKYRWSNAAEKIVDILGDKLYKRT